ncbi:gap junction alpha-9 protein-like [Sinocyclocheilus grahami]|uniref:gap junction alpha-9 protein-like n=1 Tax=Sinocyclocheilus grahami TaxID=75366 RepID=UPI0007ACFF12|nr:PREDICTED: gap junction alpha-9 protein-like [Sinocyclocheilus grahami]
MGDWNFLGGILEEVHIHSTMVGKIWLTILFIFRMLVLGVAAEDERHCKRVALRRELETMEAELAEARRRVERELRQLEQGKLNKAPLRGPLLRTYLPHIVTRSVVEVGFMTGQYLLYGLHLEHLYKCEREPCPNMVDCFISRPTEKSVFMVFMQGIAATSLFLSLLEILHLAYKKLKKGLLDYYPHLKDDLGDYYGAKKNSVVHQGCKATIPTVPSGFAPLLEKQGNGPTNPVLINPSSAFVPIQGVSDVQRENKDVIHGLLERNSNSNNPCSETRSPVAHTRFPLESESAGFSSLLITDPCKQRRASPAWNCSTVVEGNGSDSGDSGRADLRRAGGTHTPDSEPSSGSREHGSVETPSFSPSRQRTSLASSNRRAASDLQI